MLKCRDWLLKGANVMIFPEGTRSRNGELGEFKDGAFRLAIETESDVLPIAVAGTDKAIAVSHWKMCPAKGLVIVGKPISTKNMTIDDLESLKKKARRQIQEMNNKLKPLCTIANSSTKSTK